MKSLSRDAALAPRLQALHEIALALSSDLDRRRLCEGIVQGACRLLGIPIAALASFENGALCLEAAVGLAAGLPPDYAHLMERAGKNNRTVSASIQNGSLSPSLSATAATPLSAPGHTLAVLFVSHTDPERRFDADDLRLLETLAGHASIAFLHAEMFAKTTRRLARLEELQSTLRGVAEARTRDTVVDRALDCATTILGADRAAIYFLDSQSEVTYAAGRRLSRGYLDRAAKLYLRSAGGLLRLMRAPLHIPDVQSDPRTRAEHEIAAQEGFRSLLLVPLLHHDRFLGALALYHDLVWTYETEELGPARALADQTSFALANSSLFERNERQLAQLRALDALASAVSPHSFPVEDRCRQGLEAILAAGGASSAWVWFRAGDELTLAAHAGPSALSKNTAQQAAKGAMGQGRALAHGTGPESLLAAPIQHEGQVLGALVLAPTRVGAPEPRPGTLLVRRIDECNEARLEFVETAAAQLASAIVNGNLYEQAHTTSARLAAVIAGMPDAVLVFDRNNKLVIYNRKVQEIYGLEDVDMSGWTPGDFMREVGPMFSDPSVPDEIYRRVHEEKNTVHRIEFELSSPKRRVIERISAPVLTDDGKLFGQVVLYHDLTERRVAS